MSQESLQLVKCFWDEVWTPPHNIDAVDTLVAVDTTTHSAGKVVQGRENFKAWLKQFHTVLEHAQLTPLDYFADETGGKVITRFQITGKNGGLYGLDPDGRKVTFTGISIWEVENGLLTNQWVERSGWEVFEFLTGPTESNKLR